MSRSARIFSKVLTQRTWCNRREAFIGSSHSRGLLATLPWLLCLSSQAKSLKIVADSNAHAETAESSRATKSGCCYAYTYRQVTHRLCPLYIPSPLSHGAAEQT